MRKLTAAYSALLASGAAVVYLTYALGAIGILYGILFSAVVLSTTGLYVFK